MMQEERDTVTEVFKLVVTVDAKIGDCKDMEEWRQEIIYAINYHASEKFPEQAKEKGFLIQVGLSRIPRPCDPDHTGMCCADCTIMADPKRCDHQCNPLRDNDVSWEQPSVCAFYHEGQCAPDG
jgi:hypothetical protein